MDIADQLKRLAELRDRGVLSAAEFEVKRRAVFSQSFSAPPVQGAAAPVDEQDGPKDAIGAYDLYELVGEGGMGTVYRGRHRVSAMAARQGGDVAVKLLHTHLAGKEGWVARFRREAEALAALDHKNIVRIYDVVEESGRFGLVMEWVPGRPLSQIIGRETGPIPWERARLLVDPLLSAVAHAHGRGVVHRDLKPDNIRITPDGTVKVLDFGIARLGESRGRTKTGTGMGTVDYMAPEQYADAKSVDARADVYALGMTIYEMVAGRLPWESGDSEFSVLQRKHNGDVGPPTDFYPSIPPWVVAAIMAALRPDPLRRTASVAQLREALFSSEDDLQLDEPEKPQGRPRVLPHDGLARLSFWGRLRFWAGGSLVPPAAALALLTLCYLVASVDAAKAPLAQMRAGPNAGPVTGSVVKHEVKGVTFEGIVIGAGSFTMGSPVGEAGRESDENQVSVTLTGGFEMMKTEVTQGLYLAVIGKNPSYFSTCGATCPVEQVSWADAVAFAHALNAAEGYSSGAWRLPTEAEWEYAARSGQATLYAGSNEVSGVAWTGENSGSRPHAACGKAENGWGLCDMSGNVWEWVGDRYGPTLAGGRDPRGSDVGDARVTRGGSWLYPAVDARVALRLRYTPDDRFHYLGFRLVRSTLDP